MRFDWKLNTILQTMAMVVETVVLPPEPEIKNAQKTVGRTSKAVESLRTACWQIDHKNKEHVLKQNEEDYIEIIYT